MGLTAIILALSLAGSVAKAVALSDKVVQQLREGGRLEAYIARMNALREAGWDQPSVGQFNKKPMLSPQSESDKIPVILIDFPDKPYTGGYAAATTYSFDSLLFSTGRLNPTGSMAEYYSENSYGQYTVQGTVLGWYRAMHDYHEYNGTIEADEVVDYGPQELVMEAIQAADNAGVNFQAFKDLDGVVPAVIVVHAGTGFEESGNSLEIHSHMSTINYPIDGTYITNYTIQPEESFATQTINGIGVFCHEWGHVLSLPDLYDTDYSSEGLGYWSLMAAGNYNGSSRLPSHLDAWCKRRLGWATGINVSANMTDVSLPAVEFDSIFYRLKGGGLPGGTEFWLVENRQRIGFDAGLPGEGLLIYHVDNSVLDDNNNDWHPRVFLEQADGRFNLQHGNNRGDATDPYPGLEMIRDFDNWTTPNSHYYDDDISQVAVWNISDPDSVMTANLDVTYSRPRLQMDSLSFLEVGGNHNGRVDAGDMLITRLWLTNSAATASNVVGTMTCNDPDLIIIVGTAPRDTIKIGEEGKNLGFVFSIPASVTPRTDSLFFDLTSNSGVYHTHFEVELPIAAQILIVDDDNNDSDELETYLKTALYTQGLPFGIWNKYVKGSPSAVNLSAYTVVMWLTGAYRADPLSAADISAMEAFLDGGGKLFLTGQGIAKQLATQDPAFLNDYLRAEYLSTPSPIIPVIVPETTSQVLEGLDWLVIAGSGGAYDQTAPDCIAPVNGGIQEAYYYNKDTAAAAVSYSGSYKSIFFSFGFEAIVSNEPRWANRDSVMSRILEFFGQITTGTDDEDGSLVSLPDRIRLEQNFPNPFNPTTMIHYTVGTGSGMRAERTRIEILNIIGQTVTTLIDRDERPGQYHVEWNGKDSRGQSVATGVYLYRLIHGAERDTKKMILLK